MTLEQQIEALDVQITASQQAASQSYADSRAQVLALTVQRDALLDKKHAAETWDGLTDKQKAALQQVIAANAIPSAGAVGTPGN